MPLRLEASKPTGPEYPKSLNTLGDHLRARRLDLDLYQKDLARRFGVNEITIHNWETNKTEPPTRYLPLIMDFLGYCPYLPRRSFPEELLAFRTMFLGLTRRQLAKRLNVDESTVLGTLSRSWSGGDYGTAAGFTDSYSLAKKLLATIFVIRDPRKSLGHLGGQLHGDRPPIEQRVHFVKPEK